jgi:cytochrome bd ubiquinol oxidase subunit II
MIDTLAAFAGPPAQWLPVAFAGLMGISIAAYVILDGYDLGVGILSARVGKADRDRMIASIGPFWDANETWLVLGIGLLLVAFPTAHGIILTSLYLPVAVLMLGLTLRGVAFEFRVKAGRIYKPWWDKAFFAGSLMAALSQGYMLGLYIVGFERTWQHMAFAALSAICLAAAYAFIGATWLILKTEGPLQLLAIRWARLTLWFAAIGMVAVSVATPLVSDRIFAKWFTMPNLLYLAPIPLLTAGLFLALAALLNRLPMTDDRLAWLPFVLATLAFLLGFIGLGYSFYPYVVPEQLTVWDAASAPESLMIIFVGACVVIPVIIGYSAFSYIVFRGKATELTYY